MRKPSKADVLHGMRPLVRHSMGSNRVVEAVELDSGPIIVEYHFVNQYRREEGYSFQRRLAVITAFDRAPRVNMVLDAGWQDTFPKRRSRG